MCSTSHVINDVELKRSRDAQLLQGDEYKSLLQFDNMVQLANSRVMEELRGQIMPPAGVVIKMRNLRLIRWMETTCHHRDIRSFLISGEFKVDNLRSFPCPLHGFNESVYEVWESFDDAEMKVLWDVVRDTDFVQWSVSDLEFFLLEGVPTDLMMTWYRDSNTMRRCADEISRRIVSEGYGCVGQFVNFDRVKVCLEQMGITVDQLLKPRPLVPEWAFQTFAGYTLRGTRVGNYDLWFVFPVYFLSKTINVTELELGPNDYMTGQLNRFCLLLGGYGKGVIIRCSNDRWVFEGGPLRVDQIPLTRGKWFDLDDFVRIRRATCLSMMKVNSPFFASWRWPLDDYIFEDTRFVTLVYVYGPSSQEVRNVVSLVPERDFEVIRHSVESRDSLNAMYEKYLNRDLLGYRLLEKYHFSEVALCLIASGYPADLLSPLQDFISKAGDHAWDRVYRGPHTIFCRTIKKRHEQRAAAVSTILSNIDDSGVSNFGEGQPVIILEKELSSTDVNFVDRQFYVKGMTTYFVTPSIPRYYDRTGKKGVYPSIPRYDDKNGKKEIMIYGRVYAFLNGKKVMIAHGSSIICHTSDPFSRCYNREFIPYGVPSGYDIFSFDAPHVHGLHEFEIYSRKGLIFRRFFNVLFDGHQSSKCVPTLSVPTSYVQYGDDFICSFTDNHLVDVCLHKKTYSPDLVAIKSKDALRAPFLTPMPFAFAFGEDDSESDSTMQDDSNDSDDSGASWSA